MQALSESKKNQGLQNNDHSQNQQKKPSSRDYSSSQPVQEDDSPLASSDVFAAECSGLAQSKKDPDQQHQMSSMQSLVTLQGKPNSKDGSKQHVGLKGEHLSSGEADDFSLFQQPMEGAHQEEEIAEVDNTFQEINQSVDQVSPDDPDFQSILSNRLQARPSLLLHDNQAKPHQTEAEKTAAQAALLQNSSAATENNHHLRDQSDYSSRGNDSNEQMSDDKDSVGDKREDLFKDGSTEQKQAESSLQQVAKDQDKERNKPLSKSIKKEKIGGNQQINGMKSLNLQDAQAHKSKQIGVNESSKTARMHHPQHVSSIRAPSSQAQERTAKSSTRQKRPPISFALPTFSNEASNNVPHQQQQQFEIEQTLALQESIKSREQAGQPHQQQRMMQSLQQKLHINLKNLPSTSGGSSSYSNKDLSERLQSIIRQRNQGHMTTGVSPTLKPTGQGSFLGWQNEGGLEMTSSNRTGTERETTEHMLFSGQQVQTPMQALASTNLTSQMPANLSQDPYFYLQWRQQKHKSCRSAHPNHNQAGYLLAQRKAGSPGANARTLRLNQGKGHKGMGTCGAGKSGQVNDSTSSFSNSSQTTVPIKSLSEVKNPSNLITFRFVNRKVTHLNDISRFRNLTELDVNGNLLQQGVPELVNLPFLKKLNLSGNQITEMWSLPKTLEILNLGYNCLKKFDTQVMSTLINLTTLDCSNNGIESLAGLENVRRLKRLIARNNQIRSMVPINDLKLLIEMDLENNPIDSAQQVLRAVQSKKDILLLNLKLAPLMVKVQSYEEFIDSVGDPVDSSDEDTLAKQILEFKKLLTFLHNGTFFRRRKIYVRIRQQQQNFYMAERRFSNFSADEDSSNGIVTNNSQQQKALSGKFKNNLSVGGSGTNPYRRGNDRLQTKNTRTNSTGLYPQHSQKARGASSANVNLPARSERYEAIITLYDKLLEDEDKLLLQKKKKEARERREQRKAAQKLNPTSGGPDANGYYHNNARTLSEEEDDLEDDLGSIDFDDDEDDLDDDLLSQEFHDHEDHSYLDEGAEEEDFAKGMDLDDLQTYHNQHFGIELNASTADFNKEIKQINQQLISEGHLVDSQQQPVVTVLADSSSRQKVELMSALKDSLALPETSEDEQSADLEASSNSSSGQKRQSEVGHADESAYSENHRMIDAQEISVVVPERSSRYTNRQHYQGLSGPQSCLSTCQEQESSVVRSTQVIDKEDEDGDNSMRSYGHIGSIRQSDRGYGQDDGTESQKEAPESSCNQSQLASQQSRKTPQLSFKLDLAKVKNSQNIPVGRGGTSGNYSSNRQVVQKAPGSATVQNGALDKLKRVSTVKITGAGESVRHKPNQQQLMSVRKIQNQITNAAQISERIPIKKQTVTGKQSPCAVDKSLDHDSSSTILLNQSSNTLLNDSGCAYKSAQIVKRQKQVPALNSKHVVIPKLALQNIQRQPSEQSHNSVNAQINTSSGCQWKQTSQVQVAKHKPKGSNVSAKTLNEINRQNQQPKKILNLSRRDESVASSDHPSQQINLSGQASSQQTHQSITIKKSQITKTLQGQELLELYGTVDHLRKLLNDVKRQLGDQTMTDQSIVERIVALQTNQKSLQEDHTHQVNLELNRHQMQVEDLQGQIGRLQANMTRQSLTLQPFTSTTSAYKQQTNLEQQAPPHDSNYLEQLEKIDAQNQNTQHPQAKPQPKTHPSNQGQLFQVTTDGDSLHLKPLMSSTGGNHNNNNNTVNALGRSNSSCIVDNSGGLTLRLKDICAEKFGQSAEKHANDILDFFNSSTTAAAAPLIMSGTKTKKLAKTGRGHQQSTLQQSLLELSQQQQLKIGQKEAMKTLDKSKLQSYHVQQQNIVQSISKQVPSMNISRNQMASHHGRSNSKGLNNYQSKNSSRQSHRREQSGQRAAGGLELSSKREFMDMCTSPKTVLALSSNYQPSQEQGSTLDRASVQDDILILENAVGAMSQPGKSSTGHVQDKIVSDFNPEPEVVAKKLPTEDHEVEERKSVVKTTKIVKTVRGEPDRDDSVSRVGFFLEKIKERNSSLQERLNLSFNKSSRLDQSSISYRPTTSFGNKKSLKGALLDRDYTNLTRNDDNKTDETHNTLQSNRRQLVGDLSYTDATQPVYQPSKTPNIVNQTHTYGANKDLNESDSLKRLYKWDGMKPQIVRQKQQQLTQQQKVPSTQQPSTVSNQTVQRPNNLVHKVESAPIQTQPVSGKDHNDSICIKASVTAGSLVSPTNNYIDFLQTGSLQANTSTSLKPTSHLDEIIQKPYANTNSSMQQAKTQRNPKHPLVPALSVLEGTDRELRESSGLRKQTAQTSTNMADQSDKGPLFNFYQCTEVLQKLSTTSRVGHHSIATTSAKNKTRQLLQRGGSGDQYLKSSTNNSSNPVMQYSSLLKQRSNNALQPQNVKTSLLEHAAASQALKQQNKSTFIQRANSHEMVSQQNNYVVISTPGSQAAQPVQSGSKATPLQKQSQQQQPYWVAKTSSKQVTVKDEGGGSTHNNSTSFVSHPGLAQRVTLSLKGTEMALNPISQGAAASTQIAPNTTGVPASGGGPSAVKRNTPKMNNPNLMLNKSLQTYKRHTKSSLDKNQSSNGQKYHH